MLDMEVPLRTEGSDPVVPSRSTAGHPGRRARGRRTLKIKQYKRLRTRPGSSRTSTFFPDVKPRPPVELPSAPRSLPGATRPARRRRDMAGSPSASGTVCLPKRFPPAGQSVDKHHPWSFRHLMQEKSRSDSSVRRNSRRSRPFSGRLMPDSPGTRLKLDERLVGRHKL